MSDGFTCECSYSMGPTLDRFHVTIGGVGMGQWGVRDSYTWAVTRIRVCEGVVSIGLSNGRGVELKTCETVCGG